MFQVIIALGVLLALIGVGAIAAGAPSWVLGLGLGSSLIQSGSIGLVGGLLLVGIGFVLRALHDLSRRIDMITGGGITNTRPAAPMPAGRPQPKRDPIPQRREPPPMTQREDMDDPALMEPLDDRGYDEHPPRRTWPPATDSRPAEPRGPERPPEPRGPERPRGPMMQPPPARGDFAGGDNRRTRFAPERPMERAPEPRGARASEGSNTVVRSGIIHGMAYTLYADGSIEAELPIGTVRFASIEELQDHVSHTGDEADVDFANKPTN